MVEIQDFRLNPLDNGVNFFIDYYKSITIGGQELDTALDFRAYSWICQNPIGNPNLHFGGFRIT